MPEVTSYVKHYVVNFDLAKKLIEAKISIMSELSWYQVEPNKVALCKTKECEQQNMFGFNDPIYPAPNDMEITDWLRNHDGLKILAYESGMKDWELQCIPTKQGWVVRYYNGDTALAESKSLYLVIALAQVLIILRAMGEKVVKDV